MAQEFYNNSDHFQMGADTAAERLAESKRIRRRRRIIRRRIFASIIAIFILAVILFVVSLFIRVKEITITGNFGNYTYEQVLKASGIEQGDRLLYICAESVENGMEKELPYLVNVEVKKRLFNKVFIEVDYASEVYCLYTSGKYAVVDSGFKVLRFEQNFEQIGLIKIIGLETRKATEGETLEFVENSKLEHFKKLHNGLQGEPFGELDVIDVTDALKLRVVFKNGFEIKFGNYTNLDYNLGWAKSVVAQLNSKHEQVDGTLDLSIFKKAYYTPKSGDGEAVVESQ